MTAIAPHVTAFFHQRLIPAAHKPDSRGEFPTAADCDSILPGADSRRGGSDGPATHDYTDGAYG